MTITDDTSLGAASRPTRLLGIGMTTLVVAVTAVGGLWLIARPGEVHSARAGDARAVEYSTVQEMARHMGCSDSLRAAENPGSSSSSGECTYDGVLVEFRIYPTAEQAAAWVEGARSRSRDSVGISGTPWIALVHSTDRDLVNRALVAVQS